jgi:hypothetical protein
MQLEKLHSESVRTYEDTETRISNLDDHNASYRTILLIIKLRTVNHKFPLPYFIPFPIELKGKTVQWSKEGYVTLPML